MVAIVASLWRADFTRSVSRSRTVTNATVASLPVLVVGWLAIAILTGSEGSVRVPLPLQFQVFEQVTAGVALTSACIACILTVLLPRPRELDSLFASLPISPASRSLAPIVPVLLLAVPLGPIVVAPLIASSVRLSDPPLGQALVVASIGAALAGASLGGAAVRVLESLLRRARVDDTTALTLAATAALALGVVSFAGSSHVSWTTRLAGGLPARAGTATALVLAAAALGLGALAATSRLPAARASVPIVRWLRPRSADRVHSHPRAIDALILLRDPGVVSVLVLGGTVAATALVASSTGAWFAETLWVTLVLAIPATLALSLYGTDRTATWRRVTVLPLSRDPWGWIRLAEMLVASGVAAALASVGLPAADVPRLLPLAGLAVGAGVLAGVLFPSDMELPGVGIVAAVVASLLVALPLWLSSRLGDGAWTTLAYAVAGSGYAAAVPGVIARRRRGSISG